MSKREYRDDNATMRTRQRRLLEYARKRHIPMHYRVSLDLPADITLDRLQNELFPQYQAEFAKITTRLK